MEERQERAREGRVDGGQVVGTDPPAQGTLKHADTHTPTHPAIQPLHEISAPFMTLPDPLCMCECVRFQSPVCLWESQTMV